MASKGFIELLRLADLAESRHSGRHDKNQAQWLGVAFELAGQRLVAPMGEVSEVLAMPSAVTNIPLSKRWLLGVANVRGRLLPITDLASFLELKTSATRMTQRKVLVIDQANTYTGLLVDKILGIQQFQKEQYVPEPLPSDSTLLPYNHGQFVKDGETWYVFMPSLLIKDKRYLEAAL